MSDSPNCAPLPSYEKATNDTDIEQQAVVESASDKSDPAEINWSGLDPNYFFYITSALFQCLLLFIMGPFAEAPGPAESHPSSASAATMANSTSSVNATAPMNTTISDSFEDHVEGGLEFKAKRALLAAIFGLDFLTALLATMYGYLAIFYVRQVQAQQSQVNRPANVPP
ncbi:hypothetical protein BT96DRAFT_950679 [Gymnopus androsaceus JB14]|uniref:Uncharacterized protein n=1 Tax=Gymnopus androsaceus JB14 TaxID=1447944 RepID=A0A6A4GFP2_9AGAR|nr:hypothetical protein BT96DRAFT_950679 [Gymnopus androsaceus JB14]